MSSKINMFWYKMPGGQKNFGDDLGPFLVQKLSGKKVHYVPIVNSVIKTIVIFLIGLYNKRFNLKDLPSVVNGLFKSPVLVSIGSIISNVNSPRVNVWGAGVMFKTATIHKANFFAVRGKYTKARLKELGYNDDVALGDPALLLPLVIQGNMNKQYKVGVIPHYIHYEQIKKNCTDPNILVINLLDDIDTVVNQISTCETTVSTSLHGVIVSHAYHVPSLWYKYTEKQLAGDVKFIDYFSSIGIPEYDPFILNSFNIDSLYNNVMQNNTINHIVNDLSSIQNSLLRSAPFDVLDYYKDKVNGK